MYRYNINNLLLLVFLTAIYIFIAFYRHNYFLTDEFYRLIAGSKMTDRQFDDYLGFVHKWQWVGYLFIPLALLLRIGFTWVCLKVGSFISEQFTDTSFWKICIQAEIVFAVGAIAGLLYTEFFVDVETLEQLSVNPFSLQVFVSDNVPKWSSYFFNTLNVFEFSYVLVLTYLIVEEAKSKVLSSLKLVGSTYLSGLALWVLFVSYLSVVFQP
jgi:hypothetical protein